MLMTTKHWDFVDEDGCLHCNCGRGVKPHSVLVAEIEAAAATRLAEIEQQWAKYPYLHDAVDQEWLMSEVKRSHALLAEIEAEMASDSPTYAELEEQANRIRMKDTPTHDELRADLEAARAQRMELHQQTLGLRAENERLRAALQEIVDHPAPSRVATVAREALGRDKEFAS